MVRPAAETENFFEAAARREVPINVFAVVALLQDAKSPSPPTTDFRSDEDDDDDDTKVLCAVAARA
jgi:hypothetical protein